MKVDVAVKFIIVLLVIMIISLTAALIIMKNDDKGGSETTPAVTTTAPDTTNPNTTTTPSQTTTPEATTTPEETTTPEQTTAPDVTTTPEETTAPDVTTAPDEVDPPKIPDGLLIEKSFKSDTGTTLNIRADVTAYEKDGKVYLRVDVYLESYTITLSRAKYGTLTIGGKTFDFKLDPLSVENNKKIVSTLLYSDEAEVTYGETVNIKADFAVNMTYSKIPLKTITAEGTVEVK